MLDIDAVIDRYLQLRDAKARLKATYDSETEKIDEAMMKIEGALLKHFNDTGTRSAGTGAGTAFTATTTSCTRADGEAFLNFIRDKDLWHMLDIRPNKTAVEEYRKANDDLPPGINWREETVVRVRRA